MLTPEQAAEKFFHGRPLELSLYQAFAAAVRERIPQAITRFRRSQITFAERRGFAAVWIPPFKVRGRPEHYIVVSFAADRRIDHPRIVSVAEPYPHRWTRAAGRAQGGLRGYRRQAHGLGGAGLEADQQEVTLACRCILQRHAFFLFPIG